MGETPSEDKVPETPGGVVGFLWQKIRMPSRIGGRSRPRRSPGEIRDWMRFFAQNAVV